MPIKNTKPHSHPTHPSTSKARRTNENTPVPEPSSLTQQTRMGPQSKEGAVTFSSIALLQQRFRELERIREKREERLLQLLVHHPAAAAAAAPPPPPPPPPREAPVKWFFHPELLYPCRPLRDTAAALFPVIPSPAASECKSFQLRGDLLAVELWPSKAYKHLPSEVDVDTSLHL